MTTISRTAYQNKLPLAENTTGQRLHRYFSSVLVGVSLALTAGMVSADDDPGFPGPRGVASDGRGILYVADVRNHAILKVDATGSATVLAGTPGIFGDEDGIGAEAKFNSPTGLAVDRSGNVYVADLNNHTIRRISPEGFVSTLAGGHGVAGYVDGVGSEARFSSPHGAAADREGNVYVADTDNSTIRKITTMGVVSTLAGAAGIAGGTDGVVGAAKFRFPQDLTVDNVGNIYVSDVNAHTIRKISPQGVVVTMAGTDGLAGVADGIGDAAQFRFPRGIAADGANNIFVVDSNNYAIRKITPEGVVSTVIANGEADGMTLPAGLAIQGTALHISLYSGETVVRDLPQFVFANDNVVKLAARGQ
jgi:sugar lactone lactonase YvrE